MIADQRHTAESKHRKYRLSSALVYEGNKHNSVNTESPRLKDGQDDQLGEINDELNTETKPLPSLDTEAINEEHTF